MLTEAGHEVVGYEIIPDNPGRLRALLLAALADDRIDVIITNGGTGVSPRDNTVEVVESLLEKRIDGFGELFRFLSYQEIGSAAMMSRAVAGVARGRAVIALPGSTGAVRLGMEKLVLPELGHIVSQARR
jgi:molybdenum cofactor biosynthesis protein B